MERLTREDAIKHHRELWNWLSQNPDKDKDDWPGWEQIEMNTSVGCFFCEYDSYFYTEFDACDHCLAEFEDNGEWRGSFKYCLGGLFNKWRKAIDPTKRIKFANQIRDIPIKEEG